MTVGHDDGAWTMAIYFASEAAAREGERKEPPPQLQQAMTEMQALSIGEQVFFDLKDPGSRRPPESITPGASAPEPFLRSERCQPGQ